MSQSKYSNPESYSGYKSMLDKLDKFPFCYIYGKNNYSGFNINSVLSVNEEKNNVKETTTFVIRLDDKVNINLVTAFYHTHGVKTLMWFEPERVTYVDELSKNFGYNPEWAIVQEGAASITNNIGDEECRKWTLDRVCKTLRENKVEMYREDNNSDPAQLWDFLDSKEGSDRLGITECKFIFAHYDMWDKIIECTLSYGAAVLLIPAPQEADEMI